MKPSRPKEQRKPLTLEELEQQLLAIDDENEPNVPGVSNHSQIDIAERLNRIQQRMFKYSRLMTTHEKSLMTKIQLKQLSSGNKYLDDYYCNELHQRDDSSLPSDSNVKLPTLVKHTAPKIKRSLVSLDSALGKASMTSVRARRKVISAPKETAFSIKASAAMHLRVLTKIESLYLAALDIEELQHEHGEEETFEDNMNRLKKDIIDELTLDSVHTMSKEQLFSMIQFLNYEKGQKVIKRVCSYLPITQQIVFLEHIIVCLKFLDIVNAPFSKKSMQKINLFINNVIIPFTEEIGMYDEQQIAHIIDILFNFNNETQFYSNKICLVLGFVLLNALENCKTKNAELTDKCAELIFDCIEGNAIELFKYENVDEEIGFYSWQFLSFLAGFVKDEQRKVLVIELKDYIIQTVNSNDQNKIKNLDLFLSTLGLDSSQLKS